jgi:hypothetical protein
MSDLDEMLARLRDTPVPPGLAMIDATVMEELARIKAAPTLNATTFGVAATMALMFGIAGSAIPASSAAATSISPFDSRLALAPSTLLGGK